MTRKINHLILDVCRFLPFTYVGIFRSIILGVNSKKKRISMLDLGCGDGSLLASLNLPKYFKVTGVDVFKPYLDRARSRQIYEKLIKSDINSFKTNEKFNIVMMSQVLEHFSKREGLEIIKKLQKWSKDCLILTLPIGDLPQEEYDSNPYQLHKSAWTVQEMKDMGFSVKSQGFKLLWGNENVVKKYGLLSYGLFILSTLAYPLLLLKPEWGTYMLCFKLSNLNRRSTLYWVIYKNK